jgi:hypothetical protein
MLCSFLREKSVPARIRCGFARYFGTGRYEDHWVCEYWCGARQRWAFADAQLDDELSAYLSITFSADDLPPAEFLTSAIAWRAVRSGEASADHFGHGTATGDWFLCVNLARDLLALNGEEVSDWDDWRNVPQADRYLDNSAVLQCDSLAEMIQSIDTALTRHISSRDLAPFWSVDGRR